MNTSVYRPREAEVHPDGVGEGAVGEDVGDLEGVGAQDGGHGAAVRAWWLRGGVGLVVLETDPEEGLARALLLEGGRQASSAAVLVALHSLLVQKLLQLQLKHSRTKTLHAHTTNTSA